MTTLLSRTKILGLWTPLALALAACSGGNPGGPPPGAAMPPPEVAVVTLAPQTVTLRRELPGRSAPSKIAEVRPQATGLVLQQLFTEGSQVKAGQPLYRLDDATVRAELASARAALARAEAAAVTARLNAKRAAELLQVDAVSRQDAEAAEAARAQTEAEVAAARAAVERAEIALRHTVVTAPIAGQIGRSTVTAGALVTAQQAAALATIQQLDPIHVDVMQSSSEMLALRRELDSGRGRSASGQPVQVLLEDGSRHPHPGRLAFSEATVDPSTGSVTLRVVVPNPQRTLLPGAYTRAVVGTTTREQALLVPQRGVTRDPRGQAMVMLLDASNVVQARPVKVGGTVGDQWLVEDGLQAGDRVIVEGLQKIAPGRPARLAAAPAAAGTPGAPSAASPANASVPAGTPSTAGTPAAPASAAAAASAAAR